MAGSQKRKNFFLGGARSVSTVFSSFFCQNHCKRPSATQKPNAMKGKGEIFSKDSSNSRQINPGNHVFVNPESKSRGNHSTQQKKSLLFIAANTAARATRPNQAVQANSIPFHNHPSCWAVTGCWLASAVSSVGGGVFWKLFGGEFGVAADANVGLGRKKKGYIGKKKVCRPNIHRKNLLTPSSLLQTFLISWPRTFYHCMTFPTFFISAGCEKFFYLRREKRFIRSKFSFLFTFVLCLRETPGWQQREGGKL